MKNEKEAISIIKKTMEYKKTDTPKAIVFFEIAPYEEKGITQFNIFNKINIGSTGLETGTRDNPYIQKESIFGSMNLFNYCYYETSQKNFSKFIKKTLDGFNNK